MKYCIFYMSVFCHIRHSETESQKTTSAVPVTLQPVQCQGQALFAEEPHLSVLI